ncbi:MAG: UDP-N-acetylmuramoyl-L-alanyl-D-glutamate--2,6-diaminopimelate ligase [Ruminococcaceae bacterium]|nr:UDP-N-acetylmuramoyl-L-alanyl-D-glutamate--2,6-diaminopimelate ligase [Oscillospiraceae bacterium]
MTFADILNCLGNEICDFKKGSCDAFISLCYDSRKAAKGSVFVCLKGANFDGHAFFDKAVESGADCVVVSDKRIYSEKIAQSPNFSIVLVNDTRKALALLSAEFFSHPAKKLFTVGITGTKGKTSTTFMVREVLENAGFKTGIIGTTGIYYNDKYEYIDNSTPESYELHRIFSDMVNCGITHVLMEVSSQALMMHRTYGINFDIGVFTNISPDHIGEHEHSDFEDYLSCKCLLFKQCKKAILNADADRIEDVLSSVKDAGIEYLTYSTKDENARFFGENCVFEITDCLSTSFDLKNYGRIHLNTPGEFSVYNALCAASVGMTVGASFGQVAKSLEKVRVFGRVEPVKHEKCDFAVIIDYAHNALSLESLFASVKNYSPKNIITVFGCGGNRSKLRRYDMGEISGKYSDLSVITSDNPRTEKVEDIIDDILVGINKTDGKYVIIKDRKEAIHHALSVAKSGDIVLIVGKGNQLYEEIGHEKIPFDERIVVKEYFDGLQ